MTNTHSSISDAILEGQEIVNLSNVRQKVLMALVVPSLHDPALVEMNSQSFPSFLYAAFGAPRLRESSSGHSGCRSIRRTSWRNVLGLVGRATSRRPDHRGSTVICLAFRNRRTPSDEGVLYSRHAYL